jgi:hypothetical protein
VDQLFGTALHASQAVHALVINRVHHLAGIQAPLFIDLVNASLLDTHGALQAAFFPGNDPGLCDRLEAVRGGFCMNRVLLRHNSFLLLMLALGYNAITEAYQLNEYRMSNKEFRMMKFNDFDYLLRHSSFVIRHSAVRF